MMAAGCADFAISALCAVRNFNEAELALLERCLEERKRELKVLKAPLLCFDCQDSAATCKGKVENGNCFWFKSKQTTG